MDRHFPCLMRRSAWQTHSATICSCCDSSSGRNHGCKGHRGKEVCGAVKAQEREQLQALVRKGKGLPRRLLKARILLNADVSEAAQGGVTAGSLRLWTQARRCSTACANNWWKRVRDGVEPEAASDACGGAHFRRREGGQADRTCLPRIHSVPSVDAVGRQRWSDCTGCASLTFELSWCCDASLARISP
jgi:hypothetical protein